MTALRVIPATEAIPVSQLVVVIYGQPGAGKTTFAYSADNPYLMDFDGGARRSGARRGDTGIIEQWARRRKRGPVWCRHSDCRYGGRRA